MIILGSKRIIVWLQHRGWKKMRIRRILAKLTMLAVLLAVSGCAHIQTLSTPSPVTVQEFGCGGDLPSPYPPYCRPLPP